MMNAKRILAAMLCALTLLPAFAACSDEPAKTPDETTAAPGSAETTAPLETEPAVTGRADVKDDLPADLNFGGKTIYVLTRNGTPRKLELDGGGSESGDVVSDAVYKRTRKVEERLNFRFDITENTEGYKQTGTQIMNAVNANDNTWQIVSCSCNGTMGGALDYLFQPAEDLKYLNFDQPWWWKDAMLECSMDGKTIKYIFGDANLTSYNFSGAVLFNKTLFEKGIGSSDDLYKLVLDRKWTMDKLGEYSTQLYQDVNGNASSELDDIQGFYAGSLQYIYFLEYGTDVRRYSRNEDGIPVVDYDVERASAAVDKILSLLFNTTGTYWDPNEKDRRTDVFASGKTVFFATILGDAYDESVRAMSDPYGIIPYPMLDEKQTEYNTFIHSSSSTFSIPITNDKPEEAAAVLEAITAESYRSVIEIYFETGLKTKYSSDSMSAQCVDIIRQVAKKYILTNYGSHVGNSAFYIAQQVNNRNNNFASTYAANAKVANKAIEKLAKTLGYEE